jgi:hypothetical protein
MKTKMKILFQILVLICAIGMLFSFQLPRTIDQSTIPAIVKNKLDQELADYYNERRKSCELDALVRAEDYVDSIIVNRINLDVLKGIAFPNKPKRPKSPNEIKLDDTTVVKPIFPNLD